MDLFNGQQNYQYPQPNGYYTYNSPATYVPNAAFGGVFPVSGEQAAMSYPPIRGTKILLMDTQNDTFYIKEADAMGNISSFRTFDYVERENTSDSVSAKDGTGANVQSTTEYVTKKDFDDQINRLKDFIEETVHTTKDKEVKKNERAK